MTDEADRYRDQPSDAGSLPPPSAEAPPAPAPAGAGGSGPPPAAGWGPARVLGGLAFFLVLVIVEAGIVAAFDTDISSLAARLVLQALLAGTLIATALFVRQPASAASSQPAATLGLRRPLRSPYGSMAIAYLGYIGCAIADRGAAAARAGGRHPRPRRSARAPSGSIAAGAVDHRRRPDQRGDLLPRLHVRRPAPRRSRSRPRR